MDEPNVDNPLVLVVEEDEGVRRFLDVALTSHGFRVKTARNGREGLRIFFEDSDNIAIVLMDVQMADLDGAATLLQMRDLEPAVRCCFMTGDTSLSRSKELLHIGGLHIFSKPFASIQDLVQRLRNILQTGVP